MGVNRVHRVQAGQLNRWLLDVLIPEVQRGMQQAAQAAAADFAEAIRDAAVADATRRDLVHQEDYRRGFDVSGTTVTNDTIYAGVIELGRTPGAKMPPDEPVRQWVIDKINPPADELDRVVFGVRKKIQTNPMPPQFVLRDAPRAKAALVKLRAAVRKHLLEWGNSRGGTRPPRGRVRGARYVPR